MLRKGIKSMKSESMKSESMKFVDAGLVKSFCRGMGNRIFTVSFERVDGERRMMNCRLHVKKGLKPKDKSKPKVMTRPTAKQANVMTVYDLKARGYRSFRLDHVFSVESAGVVLAPKAKFRKPKTKKSAVKSGGIKFVYPDGTEDNLDGEGRVSFSSN
jgi:hypothetical protein